jgi:hypothetical protein
MELDASLSTVAFEMKTEMFVPYVQVFQVEVDGWMVEVEVTQWSSDPHGRNPTVYTSSPRHSSFILNKIECAYLVTKTFWQPQCKIKTR